MCVWGVVGRTGDAAEENGRMVGEWVKHEGVVADWAGRDEMGLERA